MKRPPKSQQGFSLIELLIVVTIIGIIAAIAVTYLRQARQATQSASAVASLRTINSAQSSYHSANGSYATLLQLGTANYIADDNLSGGSKSGYTFNITTATPLEYEAVADPVVDPGNSFQHYFVNATGIIRVEVGVASTATSPPIN